MTFCVGARIMLRHCCSAKPCMWSPSVQKRPSAAVVRAAIAARKSAALRPGKLVQAVQISSR